VKPGRPEALLGSCLLSAVTVVVAYVPVPQALRIALGVPMVFVVPGFAAVCAVLYRRSLSLEERLLASLGISLALTVGVCVLLAATPIGLTRSSLAAALGGGTVILSAYAWRRTRLGRDIPPDHDSAPVNAVPQMREPSEQSEPERHG
jgi:uncharacterized membrane protein